MPRGTSLHPHRRRTLLVGAILWTTAAASLEAAELTGRIVDAQTGQPVAAATVRIEGTTLAQAAQDDGTFTFTNAPDGLLELIVRHVAYHPWRRRLTPIGQPEIVRLEPLVLRGQDVVVTATRAVRGQSPVAFENVTRQEIDRAHYAQDLPVLLALSPGVYTSSDNGNGIGYSYLSIRGFPQRRVSVLVNGVPLNDPESHEVYWIDLPDLAENLQDAQIQRGVGTTLYGSNSIGGTINLLTQYTAPDRQIAVSSGAGTYNTRRFSAAVNSGLLNNRHSIYARVSRVLSDGYRKNSWTDLWSYFVSAARYDTQWTNHLNLFGGFEKTHLAYKGIPRRFIDGDATFTFNGRHPTGDPDADRRYNPFEWKGEQDHFDQPHFQWISEYHPDSNWHWVNTAYFIRGKGYYDQLRKNGDFAVYHLTPFSQNGETVETADTLTRRRWVDNNFWGAISKLTRKSGRNSLTAGIEWSSLGARHWAQVRSVAPAPPDFRPGQRYYDYQGGKSVATAFVEEVLAPAPWITLTSAVQGSVKQYRLSDDRFPSALGQLVKHTTTYSMLSPRFGVTVGDPHGWSVFTSISHNSQEPTNDEIFDPQDYWADARAFFREFDPGTGEGRQPLMKTERILDWEWGLAYRSGRLQAQANLFHMAFENEIVYNGQLNDDGVPIRANAPKSVHQGIEVSVTADIARGLSASGNLSVNDNRFVEFAEYVPDWSHWGDYLPIDTIVRSGRIIAGFPTHLANLRLSYDHRYFGLTGHLFSAGRFYIDNAQSRAASIDPYETIDFRGEVKLEPLIGWAGIDLFLQVNNLLDREYETSGYLDDDGTPLFIPAAKRNVYVGLRVQL